jgi:hypothetical protein
VTNDDGSKQTNAFFVAADTALERQIRIGHNFPDKILEKDQLITTTDVLKLLGLKTGDTIEVSLDFLQVLSPDIKRLKRTIFDSSVDMNRG